MNDSLLTYCKIIWPARSMRSNSSKPCMNVKEPIGEFAAKMLVEIEADRKELEAIIERSGSTPGGLKEWGAWLAEKVSRLKLKHGSGDSLGTFEALEFLVVGIHGKWALWRALSAIANKEPSLSEVDFQRLTARAESQHALVDERRLALAQSALCART